GCARRQAACPLRRAPGARSSPVAPVPLDQQDRGVVPEGRVLVVEHTSHDPPDDLLGRQLVGSALPGEIDEAVDTELLAIGGAGLDDAVGEEQNAVSLLEGL